MRYIPVTAVITLLTAGIIFTANTQGFESTKEQPLSVEVAGKSVSQTDGDVWFYWEITNPNDAPLGARIEIAEHDEEGNLLGVRIEEPCNPEALPDIFRQMTMIPAKGSIVVFYPPIYAQEHHQGEITVSIQDNCELQSFWGYYPTEDVVLLDQRLTHDGKDLLVTVQGTENLVGKSFAQIQVAFLNEGGEVVALRYTIAGETVRFSAGETVTATILNVDNIRFSTYEVNILGFTHP